MRKSSHPKILESATRNQPENPVLQHSVNSPAGGDSVFSSAWSTDVSQVNPDRYKISNFGENEFISQNLNFYWNQYEQVFCFGSLTQLIRLFITLLTTVIPCISNSFKGSLQNFSCYSEDAWPRSSNALGWSLQTEKRSRFSILSSTMFKLAFSFEPESKTF